MFFKLLKDAFKVKQVRSKILFTIFIILVSALEPRLRCRCKCENSEQPSRCVLLEHAQFGFWECHEELLSFRIRG